MLRLALTQFILVAIGVTLSIHFFGQQQFAAGVYGGLVALANTFLLHRKLITAAELAEHDQDAGIRAVYAGVVQRLFFVIGMFIVGMAALKLPPQGLVITFAVAQAAYMIHGTRKIK